MSSYSNISQLSLSLSFSYRSILMGCPRGSAFLLPSRVSDPRRFVPVPFFLFESDPNPKYWRQQEFFLKKFTVPSSHGKVWSVFIIPDEIV